MSLGWVLFLLWTATAVTAVLSWIGWRRRTVPGALYFSLMMAGVSIWSGAMTMEMGAATVLLKIFWTKICYLGIVCIGPAWWLFVAEYTGRLAPSRRVSTTGIWILPILILALVFTNEQHGWVWPSIILSSHEAGAPAIYARGWVFWLNVAYQYGLLFLGTIQLLWTTFQQGGIMRQQIVILVIATLLPWAGNVLYIADRTPVPHVDVGPLAFAFTGLLLAWNLFRFKLLEVLPIAHRRLFEEMSSGVVMLDSARRVVALNPAARILLRLSGDPVGQPAEQCLGPVPASLLSARQPMEMPVLTDPGAHPPAWLLVRTSPIGNRPEQSEGQILMLHDITLLKEAETRQAQLQEHLLSIHRVNSIGRLASGVAHAFNNSLHTIMGWTEHLLADCPPGKACHEGLKEIQAAAHRAAEATQQLLAYARRQPIEIHRFPLNDHLQKIKELMQEALGKSIQLTLDLGPNVPLIHADWGQIEQALMALLINARDALGKSGRTTVRTRVITVSPADLADAPEGKTGRFVQLAVQDTGPGFTPEAMQHKFEPFFTTRPRGQGNGMGLPVAQGIAQQHGGWVRARNMPEGGAEVSILLPPAGATLPG